MLARRLLGLAVIAAIGLPTTACDDDDVLDARRRTTRGVSFVEIQTLLERGPKRVHLELEGTERVLRSLEIQDDQVLFADERVVGRLESPGALAEEGCQGTVSLGIPGLDVRFDPAVTRFESSGAEVSCADFAARVARLSEGSRDAWIIARRRPGRFPQDPSDTTFFAQYMNVEGGADPDARPRLQLNVGPQNVRRCADAETAPDRCVGALELLGQTFVSIEGRTELGTRFPSELIVVDLDELLVRSVSPETREIVVADGTTVRIVDGTRFVDREGEDRIGSLDALRAALGAGDSVRLGGDAMVLAGVPLTLLADELAMERVEAPEEPLDEVVVVQGFVDQVSPGAGTLRLVDGTEVRLTERTEIEGELADLGAVADAIEGEGLVRADVLGRTTATTPGVIVDALLVRFLRAPTVNGGTVGPL